MGRALDKFDRFCGWVVNGWGIFLVAPVACILALATVIGAIVLCVKPINEASCNQEVSQPAAGETGTFSLAPVTYTILVLLLLANAVLWLSIGIGAACKLIAEALV